MHQDDQQGMRRMEPLLPKVDVNNTSRRLDAISDEKPIDKCVITCGVFQGCCQEAS